MMDRISKVTYQMAGAIVGTVIFCRPVENQEIVILIRVLVKSAASTEERFDQGSA